MTITKCDICGKEIGDEEKPIMVGNNGYFANHVLCKECGKPILNFMKKHHLTKE
jgi:hypothetical protein